MKKNQYLVCVIIIICILVVSNIFSQEGIGTSNPNSNAALDINSPNKGLLVPRIALSATNAITPLSAHVSGMLVYNTAANGMGLTAVKPGYYYNDGAKWLRIASISNGAGSVDDTDDAWINGNNKVELGKKSNGTTRSAGTEFVALDNGNVGIGISNPSEKFIIGKNAHAFHLGGHISHYFNGYFLGSASKYGGYGTGSKYTGTIEFNPDQGFFEITSSSTPGSAGTTCVLNKRLTIDKEGDISIGAALPHSTAILDLQSSNKALVLPRVANTGTVNNPTNGMMIYDISKKCVRAFEDGSWSNCLSKKLVVPGGITLAQNQFYILASVNDNNYLPYTAPTGPATTATHSPDGTNEKLVDVQGRITTTGVTVRIPVTTTGNGTLPAFTQTITIPANLTENNISRDLNLSWGVQNFTSNTNFITATIKSVGGNLEVKKLDINRGIGNDGLGILLGQFTFPYNNTGNTTGYDVRAIAGIPDRNFTDPNHRFLYTPFTDNKNKTWLNLNLGANYSKIGHPNFNPGIAQDDFSHYQDFNAYGSLFQYGRTSDGHELVNYTSTNPTTQPQMSPIRTTPFPTTQTDNNQFVTGLNNIYYFKRENPVNVNNERDTIQKLWNNTPTGGINNPCPEGYRLPTISEFQNRGSNLMLVTGTGYRNYVNGAPFVKISDARGQYWTTGFIIGGNNIQPRYFDGYQWSTQSNGGDPGNTFGSYAYPIRCINH